MAQSAENTDIAGVVVRPPLLFAAALALGIGLEFFWPLGDGLLKAPLRQVLVGLVLAALGIALLALAMRRFKAAGTNVPTVRPTIALVTTGIYAWSRNPIYLALTLIYWGLALMANAQLAVLLLAPVGLILHFGVVRREERYLERKFGDAYRDYSSRVRRWL